RPGRPAPVPAQAARAGSSVTSLQPWLGGGGQGALLGQDRPQPVQGPRQARLDRPPPAAEGGGHLGLGQLQEEAAGDHLAVALAQPAPRPPQHPPPPGPRPPAPPAAARGPEPPPRGTGPRPPRGGPRRPAAPGRPGAARCGGGCGPRWPRSPASTAGTATPPGTGAARTRPSRTPPGRRPRRRPTRPRSRAPSGTRGPGTAGPAPRRHAHRPLAPARRAHVRPVVGPPRTRSRPPYTTARRWVPPQLREVVGDEPADRSGGPLGARLLALAELDPADLAGDGLGEVVGELDLAGVLVGGGDGAAVLLELADQVLGALVAGRQHDEGLDQLAALGVGLADHRRLGHRRVLNQGRLDLEGADAGGGRGDHVVVAGDEPEVAVLVDIGAVAGVVEVAPEGGGGRLGCVPVAGKKPDRRLGVAPAGPGA